MPYMPLTPAQVETRPDGTLFCPQYGDVYHSPAGALAQARHVFLEGNGLPARWRGRAAFTVCETGLGLGMNFLALWRAWRDDPDRCGRLHVLAIEGHPFTREALAAALHARVPADLASMAQALAGQWPPLLPGLHRLEFDGGAVTLTLAFGQAQALAPRLSARVDAYFLDGFAPACNPQMWSPKLLRDLARLAVDGATVATWASAGVVKRGLSDAGFEVGRRPGLGGKWHMTTGMLRRPPVRPALPDTHSRHAVVVGGGVAGGGVAQALALRGWRVTVLDPLPRGCGARHAGHVAAAVTPVIARDDNPRARLSRAGSLRALARWRQLDGLAAPTRCGTLQLERDAGRAAGATELVQALNLPADWVRAVGRDEACALAGVPVARGGLYFGGGMLVRPPQLIDALLTTPGIECLVGTAACLRPTGAGWEVLDRGQRVLTSAEVVIVANAMGALALLAASDLLEALPRVAAMHALAGEITMLPASALGGGPRCIVGGEGYLLPDVEGVCVAGSTYVHGAQSAAVSGAGQQVNLDKTQGLLGAQFRGLDALRAGELAGWAGWRAVLPGRLPAVGELPHAPGIWLATGYASRGLSWSALAADLIAARLCAEPEPLEADLAAAIAPR